MSLVGIYPNRASISADGQEVSSISRDREEELLNYWQPVPSVYPQMTQIKIIGTRWSVKSLPRREA